MYDKFFDVSRKNMVNNQIITNKVVNPMIIDAFLSIQKEKFIPETKKAIVYSDAEIAFDKERSMIKSFLLAKMIEFSKVNQNDSILVIGCLSGYSVAIISQFSGYVFGLENNLNMVKEANAILSDIACHNCSINYGKLSEGLKKNMPFDKIFIEGSVEDIPNNIIQQLKEGGEIFAIFKEQNSIVGKYKVGLKYEGLVSYRHLFDANAKPLRDFNLKDENYDFKT
tara:strand:+ start:1 stop:675 length:675 start_codon:yes stop_codon:yes gene_type:complete